MPVSPPHPKGPPLNALRAFEAAARLSGFSAAAEELCVTPGAVSQHIRALEDWTGSPLFERRSQGVVLTQLGVSVAKDFSKAFDQLGAAQRNLRAQAGQNTVAIAALPSVAQLWLSPRLPAIRAAVPDHTISVIALEKPPNLYREMFDLNLFIGSPKGTAQEHILADDALFPVCAPSIAARLSAPSDLFGETLLHDATWKTDWATWGSAIGMEGIEWGEGPIFSLYSIALEEACSGAGILIGHSALVEPLLRSGALVAPFAQRVSSGKALILETTASPSASLWRIEAMLTK